MHNEGNATAYPRGPVRDISQALRKWNVTFSGARGDDAEAFLMRVRQSLALFPVSDEDLLRCLPLFLTGVALYWFRTRDISYRRWDEFEVAWRTHFANPEFQFALRDEICLWQGPRVPKSIPRADGEAPGRCHRPRVP
ncbi:hypothetical protein ALC57_11988 [Trachymyrmex cornetzi]|uniref:Retrotransposon gag domain-containing protein n=1 Tax=Trachymyrmex cornetzi TaxID=471704 RepID=A0A151J1R1_9HYME|nr:hypothetical protein ALC57_11988 [Trachymyrmex cornetzi]